MQRTYLFDDTRARVLIAGEETGGAFGLLHFMEMPGMATPPHLHETDTELLYVLSGRVQAETEGQVFDCGPATCRVLPAGRAHRLGNVGAEAASHLILCAPAGFEAFVAEVGTPAEADAAPRRMTESELGRLVEAAPRYRIRVLPPERLTEAEPAPWIAPEPEPLDALGARVETVARLGSGDEDLVVLRERFGPGMVVPMHSHAAAECVYVLDGAIDLWRDDGEGWRTLHSGAALQMPADMRHALRNRSAAPVSALVVTTGRMARFFRAAAIPALGPEPVAPTPEAARRFMQAAAAHGVWVASPEENATIGLVPPGHGATNGAGSARHAQ